MTSTAAAEADVAARAGACVELADALDAELEAKARPARCCRDVELPLVRVLADMERTGIAVDADAPRATWSRSSPAR